MAKIKIPYLRERRGAKGPLFYWEPDDALREAGWPQRPLARDVADPEEARAVAEREAKRINAQVKAWREERTMPPPRGPVPGTVDAMIRDYRVSRFYTRLRPSTRRGYDQLLPIISAWKGKVPARDVTPAAVQALYEVSLERTPGRANHIIRMVQALFTFGRSANYVAVNPADKPRLIARPKTGRIWSRDAVERFVAAADDMEAYSIGTAVLLDEWIGQREGDVLALTRPQYREGEFVLAQSKTGAVVALPVGMVPALVTRLEAELARQAGHKVTATTLIVSEATGRPYKSDHFRHVFARIRAAAAASARATGDDKLANELAAVQFMHLRHTAVTRLAEAGASVPQIAAITGHAVAGVTAIIDRYLIRTRELARGAFAARLAKERGTNRG